MAIPEQGGIVTGSHTIDITTNSYNGWNLYMEVKSPSDAGNTNTNKDANLINTTQQSSTTNPYTIASLPETAMPYRGDTTTLSNNTWGIAMPYGAYSDDFSPVTADNNPYKADPTTSEGQQTLSTTLWASPKYMSNKHVILAARDGYSPSTVHPETRTIYYGVRVDNPSTTPAGDYQAGIVYTAIANLPPAPTITTITPNTYTIGSNDPTTITITGTNLASTYEVWIDLDKDTNISTNQNINPDPNEVCTNIQIVNDTKLTCTIPTPSSTLTINPDTYNLYLRTQANELATATFTYTNPPAGTVCRNADPNSDCQVDIDDNMIPIYYDGNTKDGEAIWKVANPNDSNNPGSWYDYTNKQWANAVTITKEALNANKYQNPGTTIDNNDVLGYWVYIPRYAYEVMRPNAVDRVVAPQNFNIRFETTEDVKKTPKESCNLGIKIATDMWSNGTPNNVESNIKAKDYRTECGISRIFPNSYVVLPGVDIATLAVSNSTWATHPAFIWGTGKALNGFWIGKFETTGSAINPTVMPNSKHIGDMNTTELGNIGGYYTIAKHIGSYDSNNTGGNDVSLDGQIVSVTGPWDSTHNLQNATSHMLKNSEWGAVAYLASSNYGAGIDESGNSRVFNNAQLQYGLDGNNQASYGVTGCGPVNTDNPNDQGNYGNGTASSPGIGGAIGTSEACLSGHPEKSYSGSVGVMASTTNNVYGVYDMAGGAYEYVMGNLTGNEDQIEIQDVTFFKNTTSPPYVDLYNESPNGNFTSSASSNPISWSLSPSENMWNNDVCTWSTCGGQALHETKMYQSVSGDGQSWGSDGSNFVHSNVRWFLRGDNSQYGFVAGIFGTIGSDGYTNSGYSFRSALVLTN